MKDNVKMKVGVIIFMIVLEIFMFFDTIFLNGNREISKAQIEVQGGLEPTRGRFRGGFCGLFP